MHENVNSEIHVASSTVCVSLFEPWRCTVLGDLLDGEDVPEEEVAQSCSSASFLA